MDMTPAERRKKTIVEHLDLGGTGLEYGPLHRTIVDKSTASVRYVDYADRDYLVKHYAGDSNVDTDTIPEIDIVTGGKPIDEFVEPESVGFIVASHVAEHVPDLIGWLKSNLRVLKPGGRIAIAYPDRRFTFDIKRKPSTEADLMAAYFEKRTKPNVTQICDHFWHASRVNPVDAWKDSFKASDAPFIHDRKAIVPILKQKAESNAYTDCHCWIFTDQEFSDAITTTTEVFNFPLKIINLQKTRQNSTEFYVTLEKAS